MNEIRNERHGERLLGRRGLGTTGAALILAAVVVVVGAVSYVVLTAEAHTSTTSSSVHNCAPASSPSCADHAPATVVSVHVGDPLA